VFTSIFVQNHDSHNQSLDLRFRKRWSLIQSCTIRFLFKVYYCFLGHFPPDKKISNYAFNQGSHILYFCSAFGFALIVWVPKGESRIIAAHRAKHLANIKLQCSPNKARGVRELKWHTDKHSHSQWQHGQIHT